MADLRKKGEVLYLRRLNAFVYPGFQFDPSRRRVKPVVTKVIETANEAGWDIEDVTDWLCSPTTYLQGDRPVDHLDFGDDVVEVARKAWFVEW